MTRSLKAFTAAAVLVVAGASAQAQTVRVNYSLPEETEPIELSNGLDADVTLNQAIDFWDLTPGVAETVFLTGGSVSLTQGSNASGSGTLTRSLTVSIGSTIAPPQNVSQGAVVTQTAGAPPFEPASASISLAAGSPVTFDLGDYELRVTPNASGVANQTNTEFSFPTNAEFLLTVVPEPASGLLVLAGASMLLACGRRRS